MRHTGSVHLTSTEHTNMSPKKKQKKQALTEAEVAERFCSICGVPVSRRTSMASDV